MTARRWSRAALLACLLLLAAACAAEARPAPADGGRRSSAFFDAVVAGLVSIGLARRWRPGGAGLLVDDDRRRVPTGPNPLHNR